MNADLQDALDAVEKASEGDSNDREIEALREALDLAVSLIQPDYSCAECGKAGEGTFVVTVLDPEDPKHTRTEVCRECDDQLARSAWIRLDDDAGVGVAAYVHTPSENKGDPYVVVDIDVDEGVPLKVYLNDWVDHAQNITDYDEDED